MFSAVNFEGCKLRATKKKVSNLTMDLKSDN